MKTKFTQSEARLLCAALLGMGTSLSFAATFSDANWVNISGIRGANNRVYAAVVDGSGNLYIGGEFTIAGGVVANAIAKWDGSRWAALGSGLGRDGPFGPSVYALAVSGNDVYAGGLFTTAGGSAATNIAKWNGISWTALGSGMSGGFDPSTGLPDTVVSALAVSGGDLYAGGHFTIAGGSAATNIAKWDGSSWTALGSGSSGKVVALAVSGSDLYAGGNGIAKWDGSSWLELGSGIYGTSALAVSGSDVYAASGVSVAKWDGSSWTPLGSGMDGYVLALAVSGSNVYAGG
jgi:trimeric autotransporter adhesin